MSDIIFRNHLIEQCSHLHNHQQPRINNSNNNKVAVIVEPRYHDLLEAVVRNISSILDDTWNIHIFTSDIEWCKSLFPHWNIKYTLLGFKNCTRDEYSLLLMSKNFWNQINEEHILIFQTDCIFFKKGIDKFLDYDYIGPNYYNPQHITPLGRGIQGGVSLRKKSAMLECIDKINYDIINEYREKYGHSKMNDIIEDVYFTHACEILKKNIATRDINKSFGIECTYDYTPDTHCHHGANKRYFGIQEALKLLSNT